MRTITRGNRTQSVEDVVYVETPTRAPTTQAVPGAKPLVGDEHVGGVHGASR